MRHALYGRNFESVICSLARDGHQVHMGFTTRRKFVDDTLPKRLAEEYSNISYDYTPKLVLPWHKLTNNIRNIRNFLRYFEPQLVNCRSLKQRAEKRCPSAIVKIVNALPRWLAYSLHKSGDKLLAFMEEAMPVSDEVYTYLRDLKPNLLLVSPLLDLDSGEIDYIKASRQLMIPNCLCVASWDNLTNKGIIQGKPNFVILWNDLQKREAIDLHNIDEKYIFTTGAQLFDHWFNRKHSIGREAFCEIMKLDPGEAIITYLCSSVFISKNEVEFVFKWAKKIRASSDPLTANANILVRPHPASGPKYWTQIDDCFSEIKNFNIWPLKGEVPIDDFSKNSYFNTLYWSNCVVGINTSAFIEAGIIGKPCLTIEDETYFETD